MTVINGVTNFKIGENSEPNSVFTGCVWGSSINFSLVRATER